MRASFKFKKSLRRLSATKLSPVKFATTVWWVPDTLRFTISFLLALYPNGESQVSRLRSGRTGDSRGRLSGYGFPLISR